MNSRTTAAPVFVARVSAPGRPTSKRSRTQPPLHPHGPTVGHGLVQFGLRMICSPPWFARMLVLWYHTLMLTLYSGSGPRLLENPGHENPNVTCAVESVQICETFVRQRSVRLQVRLVDP